MGRKKTLSELQQAEVRFRSLLEKRDGYNAEARAIREQRDLLNLKKGELRSEVNRLRDRRSLLLTEVRQHKDRRNELQGKAKELINVKRKLGGGLKRGIGGELEDRRELVRAMETKQQTASLTLDQEERLLEQLREAQAELDRLEAIAKDHQDVLKEVEELDTTIDGLFQTAEEEHQEVVRKSESVQALRDEIDVKIEGLSLLVAEANKAHETFLSVKQKADHYHQRATEMREKILSVKRSRREEYKESMKALRDHKEAVRKALEDEKAVEKVVDEAISHLRKEGKLEL